MTTLKLLLALALLCGAQAGSADDSFQGTVQRGAAAHPSQYSFVDVYRVTVAGPAAALFPAAPVADQPVRVATAQAAAQFFVYETREPQLGALLLAGIALAFWVARRRLGYGF